MSLEAPLIEESNALADEVITQLDANFSKQLEQFNLPLLPRGTDFQQQVWQQLQAIPYGSTSSYDELAIKTGNKKTVRAVAAANGANALAILYKGFFLSGIW